MKKLLLLVACSLSLISFLWWRHVLTPVDPQANKAVVFAIPKGQSIDAIGNRLQASHLIRSAAAFKIYVSSHHLASSMQAGDFRLQGNMSLPTIAENLTHGTLDIWVTLLEGWRREEMADKLEQEFTAKGATFDRAGFVEASTGLEGYLFPDTYLIPPNSSGSAIATLLKNTFAKKVDLTQNQSGLTEKEVVILASILEREVAASYDRPIIAGILLKRLQKGWPLQADATIQYIMGKPNNWWPQNISPTDIKIKSSYNTYSHPGLPPTPIANPGLASLKATLHPQASEYWFYISDTKGAIHYATTLEEHNSNIAKYLP